MGEENTGERLGELVKISLFPVIEGQEQVSLSVSVCLGGGVDGSGGMLREEKVVNDRVSRGK